MQPPTHAGRALLALTCALGVLIDSIVIASVGEWFLLSRGEMLMIDTMEQHRRGARMRVEAALVLQRVFRARRIARRRGWSSAARDRRVTREVMRFRKAWLETDHAEARGQPVVRQLESLNRKASASDVRVQRLEGLIEVSSNGVPRNKEFSRYT